MLGTTKEEAGSLGVLFCFVWFWFGSVACFSEKLVHGELGLRKISQSLRAQVGH